MNVGFIGLGNMGQAMARNLLKAGHTVTVYNRTRGRAEELRPEGARVAESAADACRGDAFVTMLADDRALEEIFFSKDQGGAADLVPALGPNTVHVSMSTISVALSRRLAGAHHAAGQAYAAAPVLGRPDAAAAAKLFLVVAGLSAVIERCRPLFDALGQRTFVVAEDPPAANLVKLSINFLLGAAIEGLAEASVLIRKGGVDPQRYVDILTSSVFPAPAYETYGRIIAEGKYEPARFPVPLGLKDIELTLAVAGASAAPMPLASVIRDRLLSAVARGYQDLDWSVLGRVAAEDAGL